MAFLEMGGALNRHRAADIIIGFCNLFSRQPQRCQQVKLWSIKRRCWNAQIVDDEVVAEGKSIKDHRQVKCAAEKTFNLFDVVIVKTMLS